MLDWIAIVETLAPELWLVSVGLVGTLVGALIGQGSARAFFKLGAVSLFVAAGLAYFYMDGGEAFGGLVATNSFVNFAKIVSFALAGVALWIADGFFERHDTLRFEYALLMIFGCLGMGLTLSAADLMTFYMGVETLSLTSYVLASFHRDSPRSAEAGLKYFVLVHSHRGYSSMERLWCTASRGQRVMKRSPKRSSEQACCSAWC